MGLPVVKDVFSKNFLSVRENDALSRCHSIFEEKRVPALIILDSNGGYKGVIARRWLIRSRLDPSKTKVKKLMRSAPTVELDSSLSEVARLMIGSGIMQLPVYNKDEILGFVTEKTIIHHVVTEQWSSTKVEEIMTKNPITVEEDESLGAMLSLFRQEGFSHAPVVNRGEVVGMVSVHDFIQQIFQPKRSQSRGEVVGESIPVLNTPVKAIMSEPPITVSPTITLREAEQKMNEFDISCLVVAKKRRPVGIITKKDFLEPIARMEMKQRKLTLQISAKDVEIDEIKRRLLLHDFDSFAQKYQEALESGTLFVYLKTHGNTYKGKQLIHCRLQLRTLKGSFFSSGEGFDVEQVFSIALTRLERQVLRSKELEDNPEFSRKYLRQFQYSLTKL